MVTPVDDVGPAVAGDPPLDPPSVACTRPTDGYARCACAECTAVRIDYETIPTDCGGMRDDDIDW